MWVIAVQHSAQPGASDMPMCVQSEPFRKLLAMIRDNSTEFQAEGRILRLKNYMRADAQPAEIDAVIEALEHNSRVEALYIQNFEMVSL